MKKKILLWLMIFAIILPIMTIAPVHAANYDFTGTWKYTSFLRLKEEDPEEIPVRYGDEGVVTLKQNGNQVTGTCSESSDIFDDNYTISGTVSGNKITAEFFDTGWKVSAGNYEITLDPKNPNRIILVDSDKDPDDYLYMLKYFTRESTTAAQTQADQQKPSKTIDFTGTWDNTLFNGNPIQAGITTQMILKQNGNNVTGTENGNYNGTAVSAQISGTVSGNKMEGTFTNSYGAKGNITLAMDPNDPNKFNSSHKERPNDTWTFERKDSNKTQASQQNPQEQKPKDEVVIATAENTGTPKADNPVNVAVTGGVAKDTTQVFNGVTGVTVNFKTTNAIGYRLYRSESSNDIGISVTDFYITSKNFTDVNAEANTEYYYTLKEVLAEAKPLESIPEKEGKVLATWKVKTASDLNQGFKNPTATRHFAMLKIDDPMMSVDGIEKEVDPGRGTTPKIVRNRTVLPIRSVVESMDGIAGWDQGTRTVSLQANGNKVVMTIDKKDFTVNGQSTKLDVPPFIDNSRTYVPVRFSAQNLNCKVDWLNSTRQIVIVWTD